MSAVPAPASHYRIVRTALFLMAVGIPAFGLIERSHTTVFDPFAARLVLSLVALGSIAATFARRTNPTRVLQFAAFVSYGWFTFAFSRNQLPSDNAFGLVLLSLILAFSCTSRLDMVWLVVATVGSLSYLEIMTPEPAYSVLHLALLQVPLVLGLSVNSMLRYRLEAELQQTNAHLDGLVAQRTVELRQSLEAREQEVVERRRAEQEALQASRAKSVFLANMSHELRTPLNASRGYTELVIEELEVLDQPELIGDLTHAGRAQDQLLALIDDLLDLSRIEADALKLDIQPVAVHVVASQVHELLAPSAQPGVALEVTGEPVEVLADPVRLQQILTNLTANALRFTKAGTVSIGAHPDGERVRIDVIDTGCGIEPDILPGLFERFTQADNSTTREHGGAGLGLAIVRKLVEAMGGQVDATSVPGRGSTFSVWLARAA